ncbi:CDP-glucose 4,6-dehydratase [Mariprofundus sp. NF]|uniref:CDP-glucose 4,6-dehydratase n=1 Tax=Mariprofundus sp. NF TaxID=2608716 RepID=UPI0015A19B44|nr:CDP-glucose 4,6-dehydratase [Mariprofundus sp. NF]NWF37934.1 CDP-glucose 4,6-dehydratase [Mariprofundus sp. NF]
MNPAFWKGRRVFVTGHTGFKGSWLCLWLTQLGAEVTGYALEPVTEPSLFDAANVASGMNSVIGDIRDREKLTQTMLAAKPEVVIHMAAQALVRYSYQHPVETYEVNVMGTVNLLESIRSCDSVRSVLVITSDKCYENRERDVGYKEDEPMGGYDPYSNSKGCTELVVSAYRQSFFSADHSVAVATARAGNVIGGGDWSADRLLPDMVRSFHAGEAVSIRNPGAVRPWQHVLEALHGYLLLLEHMDREPQDFAQAWNFGPEDADTQDVAWIVGHFVEHWGNASWHVEPDVENMHEAHTLRLDCSKARNELNWRPAIDLELALKWIAEWYRCYYDRDDVALLSQNQLEEFQGMVTR